MVPYPGLDVYEALYARYLSGGRTGEMLGLAGHLAGKRVLELCAGGCPMSRGAMKMGAACAVAVDAQRLMLPNPMPSGVVGYEGSVEDFLFGKTHAGMRMSGQRKDAFDAVFCRQGVNYWMNARTVAGLAKNVMPPGSVFVFNTFNKEPSAEVSHRVYGFEGREFTELAWLVGDEVMHVQATPGMEPHTTVFRWIPRAGFARMLDPWFDATVITDGPTDVWVCKRRNDG